MITDGAIFFAFLGVIAVSLGVALDWGMASGFYTLGGLMLLLVVVDVIRETLALRRTERKMWEAAKSVGGGYQLNSSSMQQGQGPIGAVGGVVTPSQTLTFSPTGGTTAPGQTLTSSTGSTSGTYTSSAPGKRAGQ